MSLLNYGATATWTASSSASGYPASNLADDAHGDIPWKSSTLLSQFLIANLGSPKAVPIYGIIYGNFPQIQILAGDTLDEVTGVSPPQWNSGTLAVGDNPGNGDAFGVARKCRWFIPPVAPTARQYHSIFILGSDLGQVPTDGAASFRCGAVWMGTVEYLRNFRWDYDPTPTQATALVTTIGGAEQESVLGPSYMGLAFTRNALVRVKADGTSTAALLNDGVADWMAFERRWKAAGKALMIPASDHPYWVGVMRLHSVSRRVGFPVDDVSVECREVA